MASLIEQLRKARESRVEADGHQYTIRRPTDAQAMGLSGATPIEIVQRYVIGWDHSTLSLGLPGGDAAPVPFDPGAWAEWVEDQPQVWEPLAAAIIGAYAAHRQASEDAEKN